ncbi:MAG: NAD(P)H-dependent oxidoreductase [Balneolaceae bacterium]|nr:NAD(P)H-dependent oxidoreductase [Balneolaceae bacterium]
MNLKIISSTDRPNSMSLSVSNYVADLYKKEGINAEVVSLEEFPTADVQGGKYGKSIPSVEKFRQPILDADAIVWVIPEYNGSFPGILKLFIDYLPFPEAFVKTPMAFIGIASGAFGGLRAVEQFQMVANYRNAQLYPERVFVQRVNSAFDPETGLNVPLQQELLESKVTGFIDFVRNLNQPVS